MARKTAYKTEYVKQVYKLCLLGATDKDIADFFEVSERTINTWKKAVPEFLQSIKKGKAIADAEVASRLFDRTAVDTTACIFWLKNRQPAKWRDKQDHEITGKDGGPVQQVNMSPGEFAEIAKKVAKEI